jgi:hypothetical protein
MEGDEYAHAAASAVVSTCSGQAPR